jgi:phosphocarrier protein
MTDVVTSVVLTNATGLHARPAVKLTQLAKTFAGAVEIAVSADGPWVDAKSPVKVMRVRVARNAILHVRTKGADAETAAKAVVALVENDFHEGHGDEPAPGHD